MKTGFFNRLWAAAALLLLSMPLSTALRAQGRVMSVSELYTSVDIFSAFPGGRQGLVTFLAENLQYPEAARLAQIEGTVLLQFIVEKDGNVGEVTVLRSVDPLLDAEAVRVCNLMPRFKTARDAQTEEPIRVMYTLPVSFRLE